MGNDTRLTDARPASDVSAWAKASTKPTYTASEVGAYTKTESDNKYVAKETGKGLSTNDFTNEDKNKLAGIAAGAEVNVQADYTQNDNTKDDYIKNKPTLGTAAAKDSTNAVTEDSTDLVESSAIYDNTQDVYEVMGKNGAKNYLFTSLEKIKEVNTQGIWNGNNYTINGVTFTILTDSNNNILGITANGTATSNAQIAASDYVPLKEDNYIMSASPIDGGTSTYQMFIAKNTNGTITSAGTDIGNGIQIEADGVSSYRLWLEVRINYNANNLIFYPMIRLAGDTDPTFQPYAKTNLQLTKELEGAKTTTGNPITVTDAAPVNAVNLSMDLEPIQDLHGYDHPWVGGAGKNLLKMTLTNLKSFNTTGTWNENTYTYNGIAYTPVLDSDGNVTGIKANGTSSDASVFVLDSELSASENCILTGGKSINMAIQTRFTTQPFEWNPDNGSGTTLDMTRPRFIFIYISANSTLNNEIFKPMARLQSITDPTFEPYTNICPISGRSEVNVERVGVNLCPIDNSQFIGSGTQWYSLNGTIASVISNSTKLHMLEGTYTIKLYNQTNVDNLQVIDETGDVLVNTSKGGGTFTLNSNKDIYIRIKVSISGSVSFKTMIEIGSTATTYEPYKGKTYTIQLGQDVYGAHYDVTRGKMVVDKGYVTFDGSENWANMYGINLVDLDALYSSGLVTCKSDKFKSLPCTELWSTILENDNICTITKAGSSAVFAVVYQATEDLAGFKTYLASNPLQVVYELATPYTIDLTPQQIKLLENTNTVYTDYEGDTITIEYQPDNVLGDLLAEAEIGYDKQIEYIKTSLIPSRERNDITDRLQMLPQAIAEQNLEKYGYKIGDYFQGVESTPYTYSLADYNTFKGILTPYCLTQNHLGIVVDTHTTSQWYSGDVSSVGYNGSTLHTYLKGTVMDNIKADMIALFGGSTGLEHLLYHSKLLTTALTNWAWQANQYISALTCTQIDAGSQWTANGFQEGEASKSLELFRKYKWTEIFGGEYPWLRDLSNYGTGGSSACYASNYGSLHGSTSLTDSHFVVGLINFY